MSQQQVINVLKRAKKPLTARQISEKTGHSQNECLLRLKKWKEVKYAYKPVILNTREGGQSIRYVLHYWI
jgi:DNA-binding Lrp family transcriptional regulator